jgi:serine protease inhibitor
MAKYVFALLALLAYGAGNAPVPDSSAAANVLAAPYEQFGFDVLRDLSSERPTGNTFISPTSIAVALAMVSNGAEGTTREAILKTLHCDGQSGNEFNAANHALIEQIDQTTAVQISMANAVWLEKQAAANPSFQQVLQSAYSADAESLDFRDPAAAETINAWVAKHTNDRIQKILDHADPATIAILTNAIAFKGKWSLPFSEKLTRPHDFKTGSGTMQKVPMMTNSGRYSYAKGNGLEAIRLPYADGTFAMYVVLPQDADAMRTFLQQLSSDGFSNLMASLHDARGTIELPRFTITYDATLNATLKKLGMGIAFAENADFSGIHRPPPAMRISDVRHASFLKVDEEGTEAAAATSVGIVAAVARPPVPPFHMVVDHPFFVAIRDERSGQILFTGVVSEPRR